MSVVTSQCAIKHTVVPANPGFVGITVDENGTVVKRPIIAWRVRLDVDSDDATTTSFPVYSDDTDAENADDGVQYGTLPTVFSQLGIFKDVEEYTRHIASAAEEDEDDNE